MAARSNSGDNTAQQSIISRVELAMSAEDAWQRLSDLSLAHNYVPGIIRTEITTAETGGVGASRRVYSSDKRYINETVTEWREGEGFTLQLHDDKGKGPAPFSEAQFDYRLLPGSGQQCEMEIELRFSLRGGALGAWAGRTLMRGAFQSRIDAVARRLKRFYEGTA